MLIPIAGDDLGYGIAVLRELPGGLEQTRQSLVAEAVRGVLPQPDSARDRNREAAALRHLAQIHVSLDVDCRRGPARAVHPEYLPSLGLIVQQEGVATHTSLHRRENGHRGGHGDARVGGCPSTIEDAEPDGGGARVLAGDRPFHPEDRRTASPVWPPCSGFHFSGHVLRTSCRDYDRSYSL